MPPACTCLLCSNLLHLPSCHCVHPFGQAHSWPFPASKHVACWPAACLWTGCEGWDWKLLLWLLSQRGLKNLDLGWFFFLISLPTQQLQNPAPRGETIFTRAKGWSRKSQFTLKLHPRKLCSSPRPGQPTAQRAWSHGHTHTGSLDWETMAL